MVWKLLVDESVGMKHCDPKINYHTTTGNEISYPMGGIHWKPGPQYLIFFSDFSDFAQSCLVQCQKSNHAFMTNSLNMVKFWTIEIKFVITYYQISFWKRKKINKSLSNYYQVWNIMNEKQIKYWLFFMIETYHLLLFYKSQENC